MRTEWIGLVMLASAALAAEPERVIVQFREGRLTEQIARAVKAGGRLERELSIIHGASMSVRADAKRRLEAMPDVLHVSEEATVKQSLYDVTPAVGADVAFSQGWTGRGITVAVVDSGISVNADLTSASGGSRLLYQESFTSETIGNDAYGHGSHIAGVVGSRGANSSGSGYKKTFRGIAPEVNFVSLIALDRYGKGDESDVIAAIQKAVALKSAYNIRVLNLSLGKPVTKSYKNDPLCQAVEAAWKAGIVVVVAAGNEGRNNSKNTQGYGTITSPGNDPYVITVGALKPMGTPSRADDVLASYSSKGPSLFDHVVKPDLVAPGNKVVSVLSQDGRFRNSNPENTVPENFYKTNGNPNGDKYFWMSGTSMASPVVAGAVALLLQKDPSLTPDQVKYRLMKTSTKTFPLYSTSTDPVTGAVYTVRHDLLSTGAGYLDVNAALANSDKPGKAALSPLLKWDSNLKKVVVYNPSGSSVIWGDSVTPWNAVFGSNILSGTSVVWGDSVIWGDSTMTGFSVVWGDSVIWGDSAPKSESDPLLLKGDN